MSIAMVDRVRISREAINSVGITFAAGTPISVTVTAPGDPIFAEFQEALFHHNSSALLPSILADGDDDEDVDRLALSQIAQCLQFLQQFPERKWLAVGHTDTTGSDQHNDRLAKHRADCVAAALLGDRELFKASAFGPHLSSKEQRLQVQRPDHLVILEWAYREFGWPCRLQDNFGDYFQSVRELQRSYNLQKRMGNSAAPELTPDGDWGPLTWGAVFDCYELELARQLLLPPGGAASFRAQIGLGGRGLLPDPAVGCGEHCPIEGAGRDNFRSQTNKRVEVLFFDEEERPPIACPGGICDAAGSQWYRDIPQDQRKPLPVISWELPFHSAWLLETRKLIVESPAIPDGEQVLFTVTQLVNGKELEVVKDVAVAAQGGRAELEFAELADSSIKEAPSGAEADDIFCRGSYRAKVVVGDATFVCRPLPFQDEVQLARYAK